MCKVNLLKNEQCFVIIIDKCRDYELKTPEFYQEEDFRVVIWRTKDYSDSIDAFQSVPECSRAFQDVPDKEVDC